MPCDEKTMHCMDGLWSIANKLYANNYLDAITLVAKLRAPFEVTTGKFKGQMVYL